MQNDVIYCSSDSVAVRLKRFHCFAQPLKPAGSGSSYALVLCSQDTRRLDNAQPSKVFRAMQWTELDRSRAFYLCPTDCLIGLRTLWRFDVEAL